MQCGSNRAAVSPVAVGREGIDRAQNMTEPGTGKKFRHRHPIYFSTHDRCDSRRIEMTDVISGQNEWTRTFHIPPMENMDAGYANE